MKTLVLEGDEGTYLPKVQRLWVFKKDRVDQKGKQTDTYVAITVELVGVSCTYGLHLW